MNIKDTLIASLVPIFLGFGFVIAKPAFESFPPILLMGIRFTFAASILIWWFPIPKAYLKRIFIASFIANTLQYSITYTGLNYIDASAAVLLVQTEVPFGVIFAYFMLKEKPTIRALIGITIAFVGVYILTGSPNLDGKFFGIALTILGSAIWALGQVLVKPLSKEINPLTLVAWLALFSGPILICLSAVIDGSTINYLKNASFDHWMIAIYIGFIMQPITYGCFYYVLKNNPLYKVLPIVTMGIPPTGLLAAIFLLGKNPQLNYLLVEQL
jgi:EamA-like transporter family.